MEDFLTSLLGASVLVAAYLAVRFPGTLRERVSVFAVLAFMLMVVYSVLMGQYSKATALGVMALLHMEIQGDNPFRKHDPDQD